ncbi:MAG: Major facilitator superfamily, partial [Modestobacter sp.]|nr:Major facilitator superfamily [Modestobacter sp.]
ALAAFGAGVIRDVTGSYDGAWYGAAALCLVAAVLSISIRRRPSSAETTLPVTPTPAAAAEAHG